MNEIITIEDNVTNELFLDIKNLIEQSKNRVYKAVNIEMIKLYWNIGKTIVEKQNGNNRAKYGDLLIEGISKRLTKQFGKGFSIQNLRRMRQFYLTYPIRSSIMSKLSCHNTELMGLSNEDEINYYISIVIDRNIGYRKLSELIKDNEYNCIVMRKCRHWRHNCLRAIM